MDQEAALLPMQGLAHPVSSPLWRYTRPILAIVQNPDAAFALQQALENAIGLGMDGKLYATVDIDKARVGRTRMLDPVHSPRWNESFRIYCAHDASNIIFTVKADNAVGATLIGRAYLPTKDVVAGGKVERWLDICDEKRQPLGGGDKIHVQLQFTDVAADPEGGWGTGVGSAAYRGVPRTFSQQRRGCRVRLYEDAHIAYGFAPRSPAAGCTSRAGAGRMVFIAGWSVNTDLQDLNSIEMKESIAASVQLK